MAVVELYDLSDGQTWRVDVYYRTRRQSWTRTQATSSGPGA